MTNIFNELEQIKESSILHYIVRTEPNKEKSPIYVEAINALNPFVKPGYNFISVSTNQKNIDNFVTMVKKGLVEAYFYL